MTKKNKIITALSVGVVLCAIIVGALFTWKSLSDYSRVLKTNWDITLPQGSRYSEIYGKSADSFHGDGIRYHVFTYKNAEPIDQMFVWQTEEQKTNYCDSYSEAVNKWLNELSIPAKERPNYAECVYWYQSKNDGSEIIILWDKSQDRLYIVESFL